MNTQRNMRYYESEGDPAPCRYDLKTSPSLIKTEQSVIYYFYSAELLPSIQVRQEIECLKAWRLGAALRTAGETPWTGCGKEAENCVKGVVFCHLPTGTQLLSAQYLSLTATSSTSYRNSYESKIWNWSFLAQGQRRYLHHLNLLENANQPNTLPVPLVPKKTRTMSRQQTPAVRTISANGLWRLPVVYMAWEALQFGHMSSIAPAGSSSPSLW